MIPPSTWQKTVLGDVAFESLEHAQRIVGLIARLNNEIINELEDYYSVLPDEADESIETEWCWGYIAGARLDRSWFANEDDAAFLLPAAILSGDLDLVGEPDADGNIIEDPTPQIEKARELLDVNVHAAYRRFQALRRNPGAAKRPHKPGRNERCPCHSGRKYKNCCGREAS
jgi:uncharacterized protein